MTRPFMRQIVLISLLAVLLAQTSAGAGDLTEKENAAAKGIYDLKCAKCHRPYEPRDYPLEEWRLWMSKMSKKAKLTPNQAKLLNRYLDAYRAGKPSPE
jgi:hypothetical protein